MQPNYCFVSNYFCSGLNACQSYIEVESVFNEYKSVTYMCSYFSKSEDQCSQAMEGTVEESLPTICIIMKQ